MFAAWQQQIAASPTEWQWPHAKRRRYAKDSSDLGLSCLSIASSRTWLADVNPEREVARCGCAWRIRRCSQVLVHEVVEIGSIVIPQLETVIKLLQSSDNEVQASACATLAHFGRSAVEAIPRLIEIVVLDGGSEEVKLVATRAMATIDPVGEHVIRTFESVKSTDKVDIIIKLFHKLGRTATAYTQALVEWKVGLTSALEKKPTSEIPVEPAEAVQEQLKNQPLDLFEYLLQHKFCVSYDRLKHEELIFKKVPASDDAINQAINRLRKLLNKMNLILFEIDNPKKKRRVGVPRTTIPADLGSLRTDSSCRLPWPG